MALILSLKLFLISTAVLFTALGLKVSVPMATVFFANHVPLIWNFCLLCFKPPYLYFIVNGIIITIAASSRLHRAAAADHQPESTPPPTNALAIPAHEMNSPPVVYDEPSGEEPTPVVEVKAVVVNGSAADDDDDDEEEEEEEDVDEKAIDDGMALKRMDSTEIPPIHLLLTEKPLVSARFGHRKPPKSSPEGGRALRVAKPKRHETLENTWKAITEGRAMPLSRHMKKCDTWQNRSGFGDPLEASPVSMKKSETFKDRTNQSPAPVSAEPGRLRKEPSLSQDELNRRVEAFIQNFNREMRLQRQESLNQYMKMINRGS